MNSNRNFPLFQKIRSCLLLWVTEGGNAAGQATKYIAMGYKNVKCLSGGVEAWKKAGYPLKN